MQHGRNVKEAHCSKLQCTLWIEREFFLLNIYIVELINTSRILLFKIEKSLARETKTNLLTFRTKTLIDGSVNVN